MFSYAHISNYKVLGGDRLIVGVVGSLREGGRFS